MYVCTYSTCTVQVCTSTPVFIRVHICTVHTYISHTVPVSKVTYVQYPSSRYCMYIHTYITVPVSKVSYLNQRVPISRYLYQGSVGSVQYIPDQLLFLVETKPDRDHIKKEPGQVFHKYVCRTYNTQHLLCV